MSEIERKIIISYILSEGKVFPGGRERNKKIDFFLIFWKNFDVSPRRQAKNMTELSDNDS